MSNLEIIIELDLRDQTDLSNELFYNARKACLNCGRVMFITDGGYANNKHKSCIDAQLLLKPYKYEEDEE